MSSLKDLASLIMVPSLYKDGELHTVKPLADENIIVHPDATDNNDGVDGTTPSTSSNFTFSRGSNLAATRVDVNGLIEKGRENLLVQSNNFGTTWVKGGTTLTSGQSGYDGSNNAWLLSKGAASYTRITQDIAKSGVHSVSVYAKANTLNKATIYIFAAGDDPFAIFNLVDGSVVSSGSIIGSNATSVGNDWWRLSITFNATTQSINFYPDFSESTAGSIFIQSAQLEQGLVATDYIETGTSAAQSGILEDMPRLDYSGSCPSLLLEPQRSNLVPNSEYFGSSNWTKNNTSVAIGFASPDGTNNAYKITDNSTNNKHGVYDGELSPTDGNVYTRSVFVKKGTARYVVLSARHLPTSSGTSWIYDFDANNWTATGSSGAGQSIENYGNGWIRLSISHISNSNLNNDFSIGISSGPNIADTSYSGSGDTLYIYGGQVELGSYPTSYIPTYGSSQTRSAENNVLGTPISLDGDFALFWEGAVFEDDIMLYGSGTNAWYMNYTTSTGRIILDELSGRKVQAFLGSGSPTGVRTKIMIRREGGVHSIFANGTKLTNTTSVNSTTTLSLSSMFWGFSSSFYKGLEVNQSLVFETALTDSECIALTTL